MTRLNSIALIIVAMNVLMCVLGEELELYPPELDELDVPQLLADDAWRGNIEDCYFKRAPCTEEQKYLEDKFRYALNTNCKRCTETRKKCMKTVTEWYEKNQPDTWKLVLENVDS
ncbi:ejaculatory bulb-specific protein 3 [Solenopsis invicta]|nr:ejaculatory bulb-specific protein 3 [Solenopsis invicta]